MAGYFSIGETKVRPGAYFNVQKNGDTVESGAINGVVAVLFQADMGPLGEVVELSRTEGYEKRYGTGGTTDTIREAIYGGASTIVACRVGSGGAAASLELTAVTGKATLKAKTPGAANFTVTIRNKLADSMKKECIIYLDESEFEKVSFTAGDDEVAALAAALKSSKNFTLEVGTSSGVLTNITQSAMTGGTAVTVANGDYSNALAEVEKYYFNSICIDTEDSDVAALVVGFLNRIYDAGQFGVAFLADKPSVELETREATAAAYNAENVGYILNADAVAGDDELTGHLVAAYTAGVYAAAEANTSITHTVTRYTELKERLTNSEMEAAEQSGCLVLSVSPDGGVWYDNAINTLITPDGNHDTGWKKLRRVKTRYELLYRANSVADQLVGKVDNDTNGRATILSAIQNVGNAMITEGKLQSCDVEQSASITADGDTCGFDIDVVDLDSAEHIYLTYYFQFSTVVAAATE